MRYAAIAAFLIANFLPAVDAAPVLEKVAVTPVTLSSDGTSRLFKGTIRGDERAEYVFQAPAGRRIRAQLTTNHRSNYFNLVQEGKDEALFVGAMKGNKLDIVVPDSATYRIEVYLMRNAARRKEPARYELRVR